MKAEGRRQKAEGRKERRGGAGTWRFILSRRTLILLPYALCLLLFALALWPVAADQTIANQPASEGRIITPAGTLLIDVTTRQPAVGSLPVDFVRSPDALGPGGGGRYLVAVNSGYGIQFSAATNKAQQSLALIDLNAKPAPAVVQNIYFPTPQSVNVGVVFAPQADADGSYTMYVAGGVENKIWLFRFRADGHPPVTPTNGANTKVEAPFIDVKGFADAKADQRYNSNNAPVYPTGLAISADGDTLFVANNLGDSLGIIHNLHGARWLEHIRLKGQSNAQTSTDHFIYPYGVVAVTTGRGGTGANFALQSPSLMSRVVCDTSPTFRSRGIRRRCCGTAHAHAFSLSTRITIASR